MLLFQTTPSSAQTPPSSRLAWQRAVSWVLVILWAGVIFFMSSHTGSDFKQGTDFVAIIKMHLDSAQQALFGPGVDIVSSLAHFCEYTVFGLFLRNATGRHFSPLVAFAIAVALGSLYGVSDEFHQLFVPGRACDPADWLVDTLGTALGASIMHIMSVRRAHKKKGA